MVADAGAVVALETRALVAVDAQAYEVVQVLHDAFQKVLAEPWAYSREQADVEAGHRSHLPALLRVALASQLENHPLGPDCPPGTRPPG